MEQIGRIVTDLQRRSEPQNSGLQLQTQADEPRGLSVFAAFPPAQDTDIKQWTAKMAAAFPNVRTEFWAVAVSYIRRDGLSRERLQYIADTLCRGWKYPTLQIADILSVDKQIKIWSYGEFVKEFKTDRVSGYCILADKGRDDRIQFALTAEAERAGLKIMRSF